MTTNQDLAFSGVSASPSPLLGGPSDRRLSLLRFAARLGAEVRLWYRFVRRDLPAIVVPGLVVCEVALGMLNVVTAARTAVLRDERADHVTYMLHTVWFAGLVASAVVVL